MTDKPTFAIRTRTNEPVTVADTTIVTESQALTLPWPNGGLVWNRPTAVYVYKKDGTAERIPIVDVTRMALIALSVATAVTTAIIAILKQTK